MKCIRIYSFVFIFLIVFSGFSLTAYADVLPFDYSAYPSIPFDFNTDEYNYLVVGKIRNSVDLRGVRIVRMSKTNDCYADRAYISSREIKIKSIQDENLCRYDYFLGDNGWELDRLRTGYDFATIVDYWSSTGGDSYEYRPIGGNFTLYDEFGNVFFNPLASSDEVPDFPYVEYDVSPFDYSEYPSIPFDFNTDEYNYLVVGEIRNSVDLRGIKIARMNKVNDCAATKKGLNSRVRIRSIQGEDFYCYEYVLEDNSWKLKTVNNSFDYMTIAEYWTSVGDSYEYRPIEGNFTLYDEFGNVFFNPFDLDNLDEIPDFPYVEKYAGKFYPMTYQIVVKRGSDYLLYQSDTSFYALKQDGVNYIYVYPHEFDEERYVYKYILRNNEWVIVQNFVDYTFEVSLGYARPDIDYFDEFIYISSGIYDYETGEIVFNRTVEIDDTEPYITFEYPNNMYAHTQNNIQFKVNYKVPVGGNTKHRPLISNSINFNLIEHQYTEKDGYYKGYFIFTSDIQKGYTEIIASYTANDFYDSTSVTTYYDPYIIDENQDGIDDITNLPIQNAIDIQNLQADPFGMKAKFEGKIGINVLKISLHKIESMDTSRGTAPVITFNLHSYFAQAMQYINPGVINTFEDENIAVIDFSVLESYSYGGFNFVEYIRMVISAGFIYTTFLYCWRKIVPDKVVL